MTAGAFTPFHRRAVLWVFLSYVGLTLLLFRPLILRLGSVLPSDAGDPVLNTWILWLNTQAIPLTDRWWNAPAFFPIGHALTFSENLLGLLPISGPVQWLTGNPVLAYNVTFLLSFPLSGLTAFLLCRALTGREDASWLAGLIYAFAPYRMDHLSQIQVLSWYWVPIILLALHRYVQEHKMRWLFLFGASYLLQGLANLYLFLFVPVLVGLWVLWFVTPIRRMREAGSIALAGTLAATAALPLLLRYESAHRYFGLKRTVEEVMSFSGDVTAVLSASPRLALWGWMDTFWAPEAQLFPGLTVGCLLVFGALTFRRPSVGHSPHWLSALRRLFAIVSGVFFLVVLSRLTIGPWELSVVGVDVSVEQIDKPFSIGILFLTMLALVSPTVLAAHARRSLLGFYVLAFLAMWILTWGPFPLFLDHDLIEHAPYEWLTVLPGFDGLRVPARFWMLATLCLAIASGLVLARVVRVGSRIGSAVVALLAFGVMADGWVIDMPVTLPPQRSADLAVGTSGAVLELPLGDLESDLGAMYRSMDHGRPVVNGYSGHAPTYYTALILGLSDYDPDVLALLSRFGVRDVLVHRDRDPDESSTRFLSSYPEAALIHDTTTDSLYRLAVSPPVVPQTEVGDPLSVAGLSANVNQEMAFNIIDDDVTSRWETGPQRRGHQLVVDLGTSNTVGAIRLSLGPYVADYPRYLQVALSDDGVAWRDAWSGRTAAMALAAAIRDPGLVELDVPCPGCRGRFVRLRQLDEHDIYYWSIAELRILGPHRGTTP